VLGNDSAPGLSGKVAISVPCGMELPSTYPRDRDALQSLKSLKPVLTSLLYPVRGIVRTLGLQDLQADMLNIGPSLLLAFAQVVGASSSPAPAANTPPAVPTPSDPRERLALAQKVNGLHDLGVSWHLKASYEWFGPDGLTKDKGTYEEWRVSTTQYRIAFHSSEISVEEYGSDLGTFRTNAEAWPRRPLSDIHRLIMTPVPEDLALEQRELKNYGKESGAGKTPCTALVLTDSRGHQQNAEAFCFAPSNAIVFYRSTANQTFQTTFDHFMLVHGRYLAADTEMYVQDSPWLKIHIDTVLSLAQADLSAMNPPSGAARVGPPTGSSPPGSVTAGRLLRKVAPYYPPIAQANRIQGTVVVSCVVDMTGHPKDLVVLAGPSPLQQSAVDAVRRWVWTPYLLNGEPIETETTLNVVFMLGR
jgi:TonB family protein